MAGRRHPGAGRRPGHLLPEPGIPVAGRGPEGAARLHRVGHPRGLRRRRHPRPRGHHGRAQGGSAQADARLRRPVQLHPGLVHRRETHPDQCVEGARPLPETGRRGGAGRVRHLPALGGHGPGTDRNAASGAERASRLHRGRSPSLRGRLRLPQPAHVGTARRHRRRGFQPRDDVLRQPRGRGRGDIAHPPARSEAARRVRPGAGREAAAPFSPGGLPPERRRTAAVPGHPGTPPAGPTAPGRLFQGRPALPGVAAQGRGEDAGVGARDVRRAARSGRHHAARAADGAHPRRVHPERGEYRRGGVHPRRGRGAGRGGEPADARRRSS